MALPTTGSISISQVNTELGYASNTNIGLNNPAIRSLFGVSSGTISLSNGRGKANAPIGQILYTGLGYSNTYTQFSFIVPANVTKIAVVCVAASINRGAAILLDNGSTIGGDIGGGNGGQPGQLG